MFLLEYFMSVDSYFDYIRSTGAMCGMWDIDRLMEIKDMMEEFANGTIPYLEQYYLRNNSGSNLHRIEMVEMDVEKREDRIMLP